MTTVLQVTEETEALWMFFKETSLNYLMAQMEPRTCPQQKKYTASFYKDSRSNRETSMFLIQSTFPSVYEAGSPSSQSLKVPDM